MQKAKAEKILVLGVDGMDARLTRKYVDKGIMPNLAKLIERGACRENLVLLGANPTVTPPMWTTLATGALTDNIQRRWMLQHTIWILDCVKLNSYGTALLKPARRRWYGIGQALPGLQLLIVKI